MKEWNPDDNRPMTEEELQQGFKILGKILLGKYITSCKGIKNKFKYYILGYVYVSETSTEEVEYIMDKFRHGEI